MKASIIFLDIDGVLNSRRFIMEILSQWTGEQVDPAAVRILNQIIKESGAKVVISSSWRILHSFAKIQTILDQSGFSGEIIGATVSNLDINATRGDEIQCWLDENDCETFAILDDDDDMGSLSNHLVKTDFEDGLCETHIPLALQLLR